jgi:hypothetical protein
MSSRRRKTPLKKLVTVCAKVRRMHEQSILAWRFSSDQHGFSCRAVGRPAPASASPEPAAHDAVGERGTPVSLTKIFLDATPLGRLDMDSALLPNSRSMIAALLTLPSNDHRPCSR